MSKIAAVALLSAGLAAAAPAAAEATTYKGKTSQGRPASISTGADGIVNRARISWRAPCGQNRRYQTATVFRPPFDAASGDALTDAGTYRSQAKGGFRSRITMTLTAQRDPATNSWTGTLAVKVQVSRGGKVVDRCEAKRLTWSAQPA